MCYAKLNLPIVATRLQEAASLHFSGDAALQRWLAARMAPAPLSLDGSGTDVVGSDSCGYPAAVPSLLLRASCLAASMEDAGALY